VRDIKQIKKALGALNGLKKLGELTEWERAQLETLQWVMGKSFKQLEDKSDPLQCAHGYVLTGDCPCCPKDRRILPKGK